MAVTATSASAQQTQTYAYDVHGRLTGVTRTTGSTGQATTYVLDKADNRTSRAVAAPTSGLMSLPQETEQSQAPAEVQAVPKGDQGEDGDLEAVRDASPNSERGK
ncbi:MULTISPECIES: hypothetical protein [Brevundimonas]|uniref:hypothetical protein n=1 Tax=Brevundimonas TaxID=41275 RepID=UPI0013145ABA|nr:hypothetical protein [Brevundimonas sp. LPMIX5]